MAVAIALAEYDAGLLSATESTWRDTARPSQLPPEGDWSLWLILSGRGFGKTRAGAEWVCDLARQGQHPRIALIGETAADARDVMVEGESGIMACSGAYRPHYEPSKRRITWPNGVLATTYSADDPDQLRGPQHHAAWADELAKWRRPETWDNLMLGLRLGEQPRALVTTTPRPTKLVKALRERAEGQGTLVVGHTSENLDNLAPTFREEIMRRYEGTRLGRQELAGELLEDVEGAMWQQQWIDDHRATDTPEFSRVVVSVDPAVTHGEDSDETGIAVVGIGGDGEWYVLHAEGYRLSPDGWARRAVDLYDQYQADKIIAERNNGGEMVEATIRRVRDTVPVKTIVASRGKAVRAEPVAALYEQGRVHHAGVFADLEEQMTAFPVAAELDDILDAVVYGVTELEGGGWIVL